MRRIERRRIARQCRPPLLAHASSAPSARSSSKAPRADRLCSHDFLMSTHPQFALAFTRGGFSLVWPALRSDRGEVGGGWGEVVLARGNAQGLWITKVVSKGSGDNWGEVVVIG